MPHDLVFGFHSLSGMETSNEMFTDEVLRAALRTELQRVTDEYGHRSLPHLFKRLVPKSWAQAQLLNCLVEYGLHEDRYTIATGRRRGERVDFFAVYSEDWMRIVSCRQRPRHDLTVLNQLGYIKDMGTKRLSLGPRKCTTIRINWLPLLQRVRHQAEELEGYRLWSGSGSKDVSVAV